MGRRSAATGLALLVGCLLTAEAAHAKKPSELGLPSVIEINGKRLLLNGASIQKKLWFDIYGVGLYLHTPARDAVTAIRADEPKRIHLRLLRDASSSQLRNALRDGIQKSGYYTPKVEDRLRQLLEAIPDMEEGNDILITYVPGDGTVLEGRGCKPVRLYGKDFADAMFGLFLGRDDGMARIRRELLVGPPRHLVESLNRDAGTIPASSK